jgi:hypothetical protein
MPERVFYLWQVRSFTVRLALDFVEALAQQLEDPRLNPAEEHGGLLLGRVIDNDTVEVTGFEFIRSEHRRGASYDLGGGERCRLERHVKSFNNQRGSSKPVGYFRRHLRPGLFLDQSDFSVMSESFSEIPGIALAIRADRPGPPNAGIFFWEDGDIDRGSTELMFPFDAATLRVQGPVESEPVRQQIAAPTIISNAWAGIGNAWAGVSGLKSQTASVVWGVAAILALGVAYRFGPDPAKAQRTNPVAVNSGAAARSPVRQETREVTLPVVSRQVSAIGIEGPVRTSLLAPDVRSSPDLSEPKPVSPSPVPAAPSVRLPLNNQEHLAAVALPSAAVSTPAPVSIAAPALPPEPISPPVSDPPPVPARVAASPSAPVSVPAPAPAETRVAPAKGNVAVDVSVEPKEPSELKRIAGHVPLLGHLHPFRNEASRDFVSARPAASLKPQVPDNMTRSLSGEIAVDVLVSIDDRGLVKNAEITKGAETRLAMIAANTVRSVSWEPAHSGDHNVAMNLVVHYRFNPAE